jgi:hypothetical protein
MKQIPSWKYKFSGTQEVPRIRFITVFTKSRHLFLSWARSIQSISPLPTSRRSILILSTRLRLGLPSGLLSSGFPTKALYALLYSTRATCPSHLSLLDLITPMKFGEEPYAVHLRKMGRRIQWNKFCSSWISVSFIVNILGQRQCFTKYEQK